MLWIKRMLRKKKEVDYNRPFFKTQSTRTNDDLEIKKAPSQETTVLKL